MDGLAICPFWQCVVVFAGFFQLARGVRQLEEWLAEGCGGSGEFDLSREDLSLGWV